MPPPPTPPRAAGDRAADALARVAPLLARWIERLLASGEPPLTPAQHQALRAVADGAAGGAELARRAGVSAAAVSQLLAGLEAAGLVRRDRGDDRRRQVVSLTEAGEGVLAAADALVRDRVRAVLADLPPPELDALDRSLGAVLSLVAGSPPPPRPPRPPRPGPPPH